MEGTKIELQRDLSDFVRFVRFSDFQVQICQICRFLQFKKNARRTDRPTDGRTDGRTDRQTDGQSLLQRCVGRSLNACISYKAVAQGRFFFLAVNISPTTIVVRHVCHIKNRHFSEKQLMSANLIQICNKMSLKSTWRGSLFSIFSFSEYKIRTFSK